MKSTRLSEQIQSRRISQCRFGLSQSFRRADIDPATGIDHCFQSVFPQEFVPDQVGREWPIRGVHERLGPDDLDTGVHIGRRFRVAAPFRHASLFIQEEISLARIGNGTLLRHLQQQGIGAFVVPVLLQNFDRVRSDKDGVGVQDTERLASQQWQRLNDAATGVQDLRLFVRESDPG